MSAIFKYPLMPGELLSIKGPLLDAAREIVTKVEHKP